MARTKSPEPQQSADGSLVYRVRDLTTGHHYTIGREAFDKGTHAILDRPAVDRMGQPLPPKFDAGLVGADELDTDTPDELDTDTPDELDTDTPTDGVQ